MSDIASSSLEPPVICPVCTVVKTVVHDDVLECEDDDEPVDPRIKVELETLNCAADSINKLENEVQKARAKFRMLKAESSQRLGSLYKKIGRKYVVKARPYYDLLRQSFKAQVEAQKAAVRYQRAISVYRAAKETVTLAEQQLTTEGGEKLAFDSAWQEMLNHATMRFMDAEKDKRIVEREHELKATAYNSIQQRLALIVKDMSRTIIKSKPFYEMKDKLENRLQAEKQNAEDLHLALICSKQKYKMALSSLEYISEEVHTTRLSSRLDLPARRTPGVGAESDAWSEVSEMPSVTLDFMSETASQASFDDFSDTELDFSEFDEPDNVSWAGYMSHPPLQPGSSGANMSDNSINEQAGLAAEFTGFAPFWNSLLSRTSPKPPSVVEPVSSSLTHPAGPAAVLSLQPGAAGRAPVLSLQPGAAVTTQRSNTVYSSTSSTETAPSSTRTIGLIRDDLVEGAEGFPSTGLERREALGGSSTLGTDKWWSKTTTTTTARDSHQLGASNKGRAMSLSPLIHSASFQSSSPKQPTTFQYTPTEPLLASKFNEMRLESSARSAATTAWRPLVSGKPPRPLGRDKMNMSGGLLSPPSGATPLRTSSSSPRLFSHSLPSHNSSSFKPSMQPDQTIAPGPPSNQEKAMTTTSAVSTNRTKASSSVVSMTASPNFIENPNFHGHDVKQKGEAAPITAQTETLPLDDNIFL